MTETRHPLFARLYVRFAADAQRRGMAEHRHELLAGLSGRVLEIGAGHGLNFAAYPPTVTGVLAVEPEEYLRGLARDAAKNAPVAVNVVAGIADHLPANDASFDAAVASLVLCSVPSQQRALAELHRVLKPAGELRFYEHVRSQKPWFATAQRVTDVVWPHVAGGCHTNRDTVAALQETGFDVERERRFDFRTSIVAWPATPHVVGIARKR